MYVNRAHFRTYGSDGRESGGGALLDMGYSAGIIPREKANVEFIGASACSVGFSAVQIVAMAKADGTSGHLCD